MRPVAITELLPPQAFEDLRGRMRKAVMAHKAARRVAVGDRVTLLFEDRETVRWQVQEMCRVEGLRDPVAVQNELDVYNELVPGPGELSATMFVEITDSAQIRPELDRLIGIDEHLALEIGDARIPASFDPKQLEEERISAVQYVRFALDDEQRTRFADPSTPVWLRVDHPNYAVRAPLPDAARASLRVDLTGEPAPLLDPALAPAPPEPTVLAERGQARAVQPGVPAGPGHVFVEAKRAVSFADASPELLADVFGLAQELARGLGPCGVRLDTGSTPIRCHLLPRSGSAHPPNRPS